MIHDPPSGMPMALPLTSSIPGCDCPLCSAKRQAKAAIAEKLAETAEVPLTFHGNARRVAIELMIPESVWDALDGHRQNHTAFSSVPSLLEWTLQRGIAELVAKS